MSDKPNGFSWYAAMKFGFGTLNLSSRQFWSLTLKELDAALSACTPEPRPAVSRAWLTQMARQFPDDQENQQHETSI